MPDDSCIVTRLNRFIRLTEAERAFIAEMERDEQPKRAGDVIHRTGDEIDALYVLKYGWAVIRGRPVRGRSQITNIYLPGEVLGLSDLGPIEAQHQMEMQTDGTVCPFPRAAMGRMFEEAPRVAALLTSLSSLDHIVLRERVISISRRRAEESLIELLLSLRDRLSVANVGRGNRVHVPFSQAEIGDILGLTDVYVNRLIRGMTMDGRISVDRPYIRLADPDAMARQIGFRVLHDRLDTSWYPPPCKPG